MNTSTTESQYNTGRGLPFFGPGEWDILDPSRTHTFEKLELLQILQRMKLYYTVHTDWYFTRFYQHLKESKNQKEAWLRAEQDHYNRFEFNRYEGYDAFRRAKMKYQKRKGSGGVSDP